MNSSTIANHIPAEMAALPQWVCADAAKIPHSPRSGNRASPTNPTDWATLEVAAPAATRRGHWLGFCLTAGDPVVVIDIDACRDPGTGVIDPKATALLERFPTAYVEISASGTGLHVIGTMTRPLPVHGRRAGHLEIYWASRYILMTGHVLPGHEHLGDVTEAVHDLFLETFPPASARQPQSARTAPLPGATLEDDDLLARARSARDGGTFAALFDRGDTGDYDGDDSRADLALCNRLAFWFGRDPERVDRGLPALRPDAPQVGLAPGGPDLRRDHGRQGRGRLPRDLHRAGAAHRPPNAASCGIGPRWPRDAR